MSYRQYGTFKEALPISSVEAVMFDLDCVLLVEDLCNEVVGPNRHDNSNMERHQYYMVSLRHRKGAGIHKGDRETEWQKAYTKLETLKITLYVDEVQLYLWENSQAEYLEVFNELVEDTEIYLRADQVTVSVMRTDSPPYSSIERDLNRDHFAQACMTLGTALEDKMRQSKPMYPVGNLGASNVKVVL